MSIDKFDPKKDPKYISYIFRFLKKKSKLRETLGAYPRIVKFKDGLGWYIGWFIDDGLGDFIGSRICYASEITDETCYLIKNSETEVVAEVKWDEYERVGGCTLTNQHHKWVYANKQSRKCRHCGIWEWKVVKTVKTVERQTLWESRKFQAASEEAVAKRIEWFEREK